MINTYNIDNMELMADKPDKFWDLAIVDPPYGLDIAKSGSIGQDTFKPKKWDSEIPKPEYFKELKRVSKNQIIWGGNYFPTLWVKGCKEYIFWNKLNHHENRSDGELAWTSFTGLCKYFEYMWDGNRYGIPGNIKGVGRKTIRIHPTEKPVALYEWLLTKYAKPGDKILDTHGGSGSSAIACYNMDFDLDWCELDREYYDAAIKRMKIHFAKPKPLFSYKEIHKTINQPLF